MAHPGVPRPELVLRIHVRILAEPLHFTIEEMVEAARRVYATAGVRVEVASVGVIPVPPFGRAVEVGKCLEGWLTEQQKWIFRERDGVPAGEVVVYFLLALLPVSVGCAAHPPGMPGVLIGSRATRWTLAHELGHLLGLDHVDDTRRLMFGRGTARINRIPPLLVYREIELIRISPLLREVPQ